MCEISHFGMIIYFPSLVKQPLERRAGSSLGTASQHHPNRPPIPVSYVQRQWVKQVMLPKHLYGNQHRWLPPGQGTQCPEHHSEGTLELARSLAPACTAAPWPPSAP